MEQDIATTTDPILFSIVDGVALITMNRPKVYNSFNREMALMLQEVLDDCAENPEIRAVLFTGNGKAFCAGQDLQEITSDNAPSLSTIISEHFNPIVKKIRELEKPVIGAVNGVAAGAGANIAIACDITVAKKSVSFIQAFSKIGLIPDSGGTFFLPRIIGMQRATALMMLGEKLSADEAERIGMIYKAVPDEEFEQFTMDLAKKLAKMPTRALGLTKRALNYSSNNDLDTQLGIEDQLQTTASNTGDYKEGVAAFIEKRKAIFKGA